MDKIERAFGIISLQLKIGEFTIVELEGIKLLATSIAGATDKVLNRIKEKQDESPR